MAISHEDTKTRRNNEEISGIVMDCAFRMHVEIGPGLPLGLLINFGAPSLEEGCKRIVNGKQDFVSSCLRVNNLGDS